MTEETLHQDRSLRLNVPEEMQLLRWRKPLMPASARHA
jgi:hypothetical protein